MIKVTELPEACPKCKRKEDYGERKIWGFIYGAVDHENNELKEEWVMAKCCSCGYEVKCEVGQRG